MDIGSKVAYYRKSFFLNYYFRSENELLFLIDSLRSSDFGKKLNIKEEEDIDEDQLLDKSAKLKGFFIK